MRTSVVTVYILLLGVCVCSAQDLNTKIRKIWDNMDTNVTDGRLEYYEVEQYFFNSNSNYVANGQIIFLNFDYEWGPRYDDPRAVTEYIFQQWDVDTDTGTLDPFDIQVLANELDTGAATSLGYIDYSTEFYVYFEKLYLAGPGYGRRL